jgi:hypothetical protein
MFVMSLQSPCTELVQRQACPTVLGNRVIA